MLREGRKDQQHQMRADIGKKRVFSVYVQITLRLDIVVWSQKPKIILAVEPTGPLEERRGEAYQRKKKTYAELITTF